MEGDRRYYPVCVISLCGKKEVTACSTASLIRLLQYHTSYQQDKVNNYDNKYFSKYMPDFALIAHEI